MTRSFGIGTAVLGLALVGGCDDGTAAPCAGAECAERGAAAGGAGATAFRDAGDSTVRHEAAEEGGGGEELCPDYEAAALYRPRDRRVVVGPGDDWIAAVEGAAPGTEVVLRPGEYRFGGEVNVDIGAAVTLRGETGDPHDVVLRGDGYDVEGEGLTIRGRDVTIAELSVGDVRTHAIFVKGEDGAHAPHIYDVRLFDTGEQHIKLTPGGARDGVVACSEIFYHPGAVQGDYIDAIDLHEAIDWTIRDNYIHGIRGDGSGCAVDVRCGTFVSGPAILVWNRSRGTVIERNVLEDNYRGISLGLQRGHEGGVVRDNFVYATGADDRGIELESAVGARIVNNTVLVPGPDRAVQLRNSHDIEVVNNLLSVPVWRWGDVSFDARGNITDARDDDFRAPGDYRLRPGSRAIGAGVDDPDVGRDIDGNRRDGRIDVGCSQAP